MALAHFTLATQHVERTAAFIEQTLGYVRKDTARNSPVPAVWFDIGRGQEMHILHVDGFQVSPFENEFGRHVAVFFARDGFAALKERLTTRGGELIAPLRATPFERFFFREPVNGYIFEVIDEHGFRNARV